VVADQEGSAGQGEDEGEAGQNLAHQAVVGAADDDGVQRQGAVHDAEFNRVPASRQAAGDLYALTGCEIDQPWLPTVHGETRFSRETWFLPSTMIWAVPALSQVPSQGQV